MVRPNEGPLMLSSVELSAPFIDFDDDDEDEKVLMDSKDEINEEGNVLGSSISAYVNRSGAGNKRAPARGKASLEELHQTAAKLVRETRVSLTVEVEQPKSLNSFLAGLQPDSTMKQTKKDPINPTFKNKSWVKQMSREEIERIQSVKPKLSCGSSFITTDGDQLEIITNNRRLPTSQRLAEQKRQRQALVPKVKKPSIDSLNDRLDTKIAIQKKAQALARRLEEPSMAIGNEEPNYDFDKCNTLVDRAIETESDDGDTEEEEQFESDEAEEEDENDDFKEDEIGWKATKSVTDLSRQRRPVIASDDEEDQSDLIDALLPPAAEDDDDDEELEELLSKPLNELTSLSLKQTDLSKFLSGKFDEPESKFASEKKQLEEVVSPKENKKKKVGMSSAFAKQFFEEEAEDEDEEIQDEIIDEAAIQAELEASKFILADQPDDEEGDDGHHLSIHRSLMMEDDDKQLDLVIQKFAKDKDINAPSLLDSLHHKYNEEDNDDNDEEDEQDVDTDDDGDPTERRRKMMENRKDALLFKLIEDERSDGDLLDDDDNASYSESDPYHDDDEDDDIDVDVENDAVDLGGPVADLQESLSAFFTTTTTTDKSNTSSNTRRHHAVTSMSSMDPDRKAKLLSMEADTTSTKAPIGAAFKKIKKK